MPQMEERYSLYGSKRKGSKEGKVGRQVCDGNLRFFFNLMTSILPVKQEAQSSAYYEVRNGKSDI